MGKAHNKTNVKGEWAQYVKYSCGHRIFTLTLYYKLSKKQLTMDCDCPRCQIEKSLGLYGLPKRVNEYGITIYDKGGK